MSRNLYPDHSKEDIDSDTTSESEGGSVLSEESLDSFHSANSRFDSERNWGYRSLPTRSNSNLDLFVDQSGEDTIDRGNVNVREGLADILDSVDRVQREVRRLEERISSTRVSEVEKGEEEEKLKLRNQDNRGNRGDIGESSSQDFDFNFNSVPMDGDSEGYEYVNGIRGSNISLGNESSSVLNNSSASLPYVSRPSMLTNISGVSDPQSGVAITSSNSSFSNNINATNSTTSTSSTVPTPLESSATSTSRYLPPISAPSLSRRRNVLSSLSRLGKRHSQADSTDFSSSSFPSGSSQFSRRRRRADSDNDNDDSSADFHSSFNSSDSRSKRRNRATDTFRKIRNSVIGSFGEGSSGSSSSGGGNENAIPTGVSGSSNSSTHEVSSSTSSFSLIPSMSISSNTSGRFGFSNDNNQFIPESSRSITSTSGTPTSTSTTSGTSVSTTPRIRSAINPILPIIRSSNEPFSNNDFPQIAASISSESNSISSTASNHININRTSTNRTPAVTSSLINPPPPSSPPPPPPPRRFNLPHINLPRPQSRIPNRFNGPWGLGIGGPSIVTELRNRQSNEINNQSSTQSSTPSNIQSNIQSSRLSRQPTILPIIEPTSSFQPSIRPTIRSTQSMQPIQPPPLSQPSPLSQQQPSSSPSQPLELRPIATTPQTDLSSNTYRRRTHRSSDLPIRLPSPLSFSHDDNEPIRRPRWANRRWNEANSRTRFTDSLHPRARVSNNTTPDEPDPSSFEGQAAMLARLLAVAASVTARSLVGPMRTSRGFSYGRPRNDSVDESFNAFLDGLNNGLLESELSSAIESNDSNNDTSSSSSSSSTSSTSIPTPRRPQNFFRMFRFPPSQSAGENRESNLIPVLIVGVRAVENNENNENNTTDHVGLSLLDALASSAQPSVRHDDNNNNIPSTSTSTPTPTPVSTTTSTTPTQSTNRSSSTFRNLFESIHQRSRDSVVNNLFEERNDDNDNIYSNRSSSDVTRNSSSSESTFGRINDSVLNNSNNNDTTSSTPREYIRQSWIVYVVGGSYPENHPILSAPTLLTDNPSYEDLLILESFLGQVKSPVATKEEVTSSGGVLVVGGLGPESVDVLPDDRCLVCLSNYEQFDECRKLNSCGHMFHKECIDQWLLTGRNSCPLCRTEGVKSKSLAENHRPPTELPTN